MDAADHATEVADRVVNLYRLLLDSKHRLEFEEARDRLGLSDEEMRVAVELLNDFYDSYDRDEVVV